MQEEKIIIGITGHPSSGKDTVAEYLVEQYGFILKSGGDMLREYIRKHNLGEATRERVSELATRLREERGSDFLMKMSLATDTPRLVLSGLRTPSEVTLMKEYDGILISVVAPLETRYARAKNRSRIGDDCTLEAFKAIEEKEASARNEYEHDVDAVIRMADHTIVNDGDLADLYAETEQLLKELGVTTHNENSGD